MFVPLFTSAKKQAMGIVNTYRQTSQVDLRSQVQWQTPSIILGSHHSEDKAREEVRGHVAALMRCEARYMEEKAAREGLEAKMHAQDVYNSTLVTGLEEKLDYADGRLHDVQLDLDSAQDNLAKETAKRKTLEFSFEALTSRYDALSQVLENSQRNQEQSAARCRSFQDAAQQHDRLASELKETRTALAEMRNLYAATTSSASVLQEQVSSLLVTVSALRVERDELRCSLRAAREEAALARAEASAARTRLQEELRRNRALEIKLRETDSLLAAAERKAADADWTARDEFAKPKSRFAITVVDVDLLEAQMERDLYRSQYEEETAAREKAEHEKDEMASQLEAALGEVNHLKVERKEQETAAEGLRQQLRAATDAHTDALKTTALEVDGLKARLEESERRRIDDSPYAKENEAPDVQYRETPSPTRPEDVYKTMHRASAFEFASGITSHSSPILSSESFWGNSGMLKLGLREFEDFAPWATSDVKRPSPEEFNMPAFNNNPAFSSSPTTPSSSSNVLFYSPTLFRQLIVQDNAGSASQYNNPGNDSLVLS